MSHRSTPTLSKAQLATLDSEAARYTNHDLRQEFWLGALSAGGDIEAGHAAARKAGNDACTDKIRFVSLKRDPSYTPDYPMEESEAQAEEPDSAQQFERMFELIDMLTTEEQDVVRDMLNGVSELETAARLRCSQSNVSQKRTSITKKLRVLVEVLAFCAANPVTEADLAPLSPARRRAIEALLAGRKFARSTVLRAADELQPKVREHVRLRLKWRVRLPLTCERRHL